MDDDGRLLFSIEIEGKSAEDTIQILENRVEDLVNTLRDSGKEMEATMQKLSEVDDIDFENALDGLAEGGDKGAQALKKINEEVRDISEAGYGKQAVDILNELKESATDDETAGAIDKLSGAFKSLSSVELQSAKYLETFLGELSKGRSVAGAFTKTLGQVFKDLTAQTKAEIAAAKASSAASGAKLGFANAAKVARAAVVAFTKALLTNPIFLLIAAVAALTIGIVALAKSIKTATERQIELNKAEAAYLEMLGAVNDIQNNQYDRRIKDKERELALLKASNGSLKEQHRLEDEIIAIEKEKAANSKKNNQEYVDGLEENEKALVRQQKALAALEMMENGGKRKKEVNEELSEQGVEVKRKWFLGRKRVYVDGVEVSSEVGKKAIEAINGQIKNSEKKVELGVESIDLDKVAKQKEAETEANRKEEYKNQLKKEQSEVNAAKSAEISLINDAYERDIANLKHASDVKIQNLKRRLAEEKDLTVNARNAINRQIALIALKERKDEEERQKQEFKTQLNWRRKISAELLAQDETYAGQEKANNLRLDREIVDLELQLDDDKLSKEQKELVRQLIQIKKDNKPIEQTKFKLIIDAEKAQNAVDALNLSIASVKEGTLEEYELQKQLIELNRQAELAENRTKKVTDRKSEKDINAKYDKQQADYQKNRINAYDSYQKQMTDLLVNSENDRLVIQKQLSDEEAKAENERDNKKIEELKRKLSILKITTEREYKDLQKELIRSSLGDVFIESTYANVKEAMKQIDELLGMSFEDFKLSPYGNDNATEADWNAFLKNVRKIRSEIDDMDKGSYNLKRAFQDAFTGKTREDMEKGTQKLLDGFNKVGNVVSGLADALRDFADATNNVHLEKMADTFSEIANTISNATGYAQAGATVGGGWGAIIGAVLGIGQGVATAWLDSRTKKWAEIEEDYRKSLESINDTSAEEIFASAVEAFANSVKSLDYTNYQKSVLDLINELKKSGVESMQSWRSLYESAGPYQIIQNGTYDRDAIVKWLNDKYGGQIQFALDYINTATGNGVNGQGYTSFEELLAELNSGTASDTLKNLIQTVLEKYVGEDYGAILGLLESEGWSDEVFAAFSQAAIATSETVRTAFKTSYADIMNARNQQTNQERADLIKRLQELLESGSTNTLEYMNALYEADKMNLELLRERYLILKNAGQDTTEIEAQISEAEYNMANRTKDMVQALAGVDFASIVSKWGDIFKEFGTDTTAAFDKISESVDDMIANFLYQTYFVAPAMKRLNNSLSDFAKLYGIEADEEGNYNLTEEQLKNYYEYLKEIGKATAEDYEEWKRQMEALGIPIDAVNDRSATSRGIAQASQESVDELNGRMTAVEGHTFSINENTQVIRDTVLAINSNVAAIRDYTSNLVQMREDMNAMRSAIEHMDNNGVYLDTDRN